MTHQVVTTSLLFLGVLAGFAPSQSPTHETGLLRDQKFTEGHAESDIRRMGLRMQWKPEGLKQHDPAGGVYQREAETYTAYVPPTYSGESLWGLLVWVHPVDHVDMNPPWAPVLEKLKVIVVAPDKIGNERFVWNRMGIALDAVATATARWKIDPKRIWISGFSGGGRTAQALGLHYPDVFTGGYYQGGCNWYAEVPNPKAKGESWAPRIPKPGAGRLDRTRHQVRHVIYAGEKDFNHDHSAGVHSAMKKAGFRHLLFQEMPGAGHELPSAEIFQAGLEFLQAEAAKKSP